MLRVVIYSDRARIKLLLHILIFLHNFDCLIWIFKWYLCRKCLKIQLVKFPWETRSRAIMSKRFRGYVKIKKFEICFLNKAPDNWPWWPSGLMYDVIPLNCFMVCIRSQVWIPHRISILIVWNYMIAFLLRWKNSLVP